MNHIVAVMRLSVLCVLSALPGFSAANTNLVLATGSEQGVYFRIGTAIAANAKGSGLALNVMHTEGSRENLLLLSSGKAQLCIAQSDVIQEALAGTGFFTEPLTNIQAIALLRTEAVHIFVRTPLHCTHVHDFRSKRIAVGQDGSGTEANARLILESAGVSAAEATLLNLSFDEAIASLAKNQLDIVFFTAGYPIPGAVKCLVDSQATLFELPEVPPVFWTGG